MKLGVKRVSKLAITVALMIAISIMTSIFGFGAMIVTNGNNPYTYGDWGSLKLLYDYFAPGYSSSQLMADIYQNGRTSSEIIAAGQYCSLNADTSYEVVTYTETSVPNPNQFVSSGETTVAFLENSGANNSLCAMLTFSKPYTVYESNTFSSCSNLETIVFLQDGSYEYDIIKTLMLEYYGSTTLTIGDGAFSNCPKLSSLVFCTDDINISSTAFSGSNKNITVYGPVSGGNLESWAKSRGFTYVAYNDLADTPAADAAPGNSTNNDSSYDEIKYIYTGESKPTNNNTNTSSSPFTDVSSSDWYYESVVQAHKLGVIDGYGNGQFGPKDSITRAQICQILYNYYGNGKTYSTTFTDVPANEWYVNAIGWAENTGAVKGYGNGAFGPNDNVTYEQIAQILYNLEGNPDIDTSVLNNKSYTVSDWAKAPYAWAVKNNIVSENSVGSTTNSAAIRGWVADAVVKYLAAFEGVTLPTVE